MKKLQMMSIIYYLNVFHLLKVLDLTEKLNVLVKLELKLVYKIGGKIMKI